MSKQFFDTSQDAPVQYGDALVQHNNQAYLIGGAITRSAYAKAAPSNAIVSLQKNPSTKFASTELFPPRMLHSANLLNEQVVIFGGRNEFAVFHDLVCLNWSMLQKNVTFIFFSFLEYGNHYWYTKQH